MLVNKQVLFHVKRYAKSNVYISATEAKDLLDNLSTMENKIYITLKESVMQNPTPDFFTSANLAVVLQASPSSIDNARSKLKTKGYAQIIHFRDENKRPMVRVVIGKDQMRLYSLGVMCEITNAKAFNKLLDMFPVLDPKYTEDERQDIVNQLNQHYIENKGEFQ